jgi:acyl carrier protein
MMEPQDLELRIRTAIARALGRNVAEIDNSAAMGMTPGWDSMGHMNVVMELESEFTCSFPAYKLPELSDVAAVARIVRGMQG